MMKPRFSKTTQSPKKAPDPFLVGAVIFALLLWPAVADACPNCKNNLGANHQAMGFAISIVFMMGMPFAIFAGWCLTIWRLIKKRA